MKRRRYLVFFALYLSLLVAGHSFGQSTTGQLTGVVTETSGAVVPAAKVMVTNPDTGITRQSETNELGY